MTKRKSATVVPINGDYQASRFNATRHGILSRHAVLPWEDRDTYDQLLADLSTEYSPRGPTERHLVEALATIMWRQQRVLLAESSEYRRGLESTVNPIGTDRLTARALISLDVGRPGEKAATAITMTPDDDATELEDVTSDRAMTDHAREILAEGGAGAYDRALAALRDDTREWWEGSIGEPPDDDDDDGVEPYQPTATDLQRFLDNRVRRFLIRHQADIENRPYVRSQAFGEATPTNRLNNLTRYETHLDRKLERTIGMLMKLRDMRRTIPATTDA